MMKKNLLPLILAGVFLLMIQSCNKDKSSNTNQTPQQAGTILKLNSAGQHGTFGMLNATSNKRLEIANFALNNYATADEAASNGTAHQQFRITDLGTGYYQIMNCGSGKLLQSYNYNGTQVLVQNSAIANYDGQLWSIVYVINGRYKIINKLSGLLITSGSVETLTADNGNNAQLFIFNQYADQAYRDDAVVNFFHRTHGSISFDQGNSIPLTYAPNNGKVLWMTEDTYTDVLLKPNGEFNCPQFFNIHNSALLQPASHSWDQLQTNNLVTHNSTFNDEILASPGTDHNASYTWPSVGIEIGSHVYAMAAEGPASAGFNTSVLYDFTENATGGLDWGTAVRHTVPGVSDQDTIGYYAGMVKPGDGYVYAYGTKGVFIYNNIYLARFAESNPFVWTFWNGTTWVAKPSTSSAAALQFIGHDAGTLANVCVSYANGKYVMMQMDLGYFCDNNPHNIYMSTATNITGPFTNKIQVFTIEDMINGHLCNYYTPCIHPEFVNGQNELLVTYCLNYTACNVSTCTNGYLDPNYYQVKGVRIPYSLIGL